MKRTRLKTAWFFGITIAILTGLSIFFKLPSVATIGMAALGGIVAKYSHDETKRKSIK